MAAHHAAQAGGGGERRHKLDAHARVGVGLLARQQIERQCQQAVANKDGGRLVKGFVRGRPPPPQIVVVHGGKIIVNKRIAVHDLDRAADHQRLGARPPEQAGGLHGEKRAETLAAPKRGITHCLEQPRRPRALAWRRLRGKQAVEQTFHVSRHLVEPLPKHRVGRGERVDFVGFAQQASPHSLAHLGSPTNYPTLARSYTRSAGSVDLAGRPCLEGPSGLGWRTTAFDTAAIARCVTLPRSDSVHVRGRARHTHPMSLSPVSARLTRLGGPFRGRVRSSGPSR